MARHPRPASWSSPTSPATPRTSRGARSSTRPLIAGDLLETIVGRLEPPFRLAKFEGDAAFLFVEDGRADGSLLLDAIEAAYLAFRRRLRSIDQATSCDCNSCRLAPRLDLKLFVHHGSFVRSRIAGRDELAGSDVIVVHRLLKGADGRRRAGQRLRAVHRRRRRRPRSRSRSPWALAGGRRRSSTSARVDTFTLDLEARWQAESGIRRLDIGATPISLRHRRDRRGRPGDRLGAPDVARPADAWEGPIVIEETSAGGRRGVGTRAQCVTGRLATLEEIVDWQPYDRVAWRLAVPGVGPVAATADLEPVGGGHPPPPALGVAGGAPGRSGRCPALPGGQGGGGGSPRKRRRRRAAGRRAEEATR